MCSIRTSIVAFYNCKSSVVIPTLASAVGTKLGRLFGQVIFCEYNKSKEKEQGGTSVSDNTDTDMCERGLEHQSICDRNNRRGSVSSFIRRFISFGVLEIHSEVPFPRIGGDSDGRLSEEKSARKNEGYCIRQEMNSIMKKCCVFRQDPIVRIFLYQRVSWPLQDVPIKTLYGVFCRRSSVCMV